MPFPLRPALAAALALGLTAPAASQVLADTSAAPPRATVAPPAPTYVGGAGAIGLSLDEAIQIALERAYSVRLAELDVATSRAQVREAYGGLFPRVEVSSSYTRNVVQANPFAGSSAGGIFGSLGAVGWLQYNEAARQDDDPTTEPLTLTEYNRRVLEGQRAIGFDPAAEAGQPVRDRQPVPQHALVQPAALQRGGVRGRQGRAEPRRDQRGGRRAAPRRDHPPDARGLLRRAPGGAAGGRPAGVGRALARDVRRRVPPRGPGRPPGVGAVERRGRPRERRDAAGPGRGPGADGARPAPAHTRAPGHDAGRPRERPRPAPPRPVPDGRAWRRPPRRPSTSGPTSARRRSPSTWARSSGGSPRRRPTRR